MGKRNVILSLVLWLIATTVFLLIYNIRGVSLNKEDNLSLEKGQVIDEEYTEPTTVDLSDSQKTNSSIQDILIDEENNNLESDLLKNNEIPNNKNEYSKEDLVPYGGVVEHIFFHPLIVYPERAFDGDAGAKGMDNYMATALECKRLLEEAYKNDYVLIDINKVYNKVMQHDGTYKMERIFFNFPKNKKPLVISMDDVNYYDYMINDGCNFKVVLDNDGKVATYSKDLNDKDVLSYDTEVITIVDNFVLEHPDFSFDGARGIIGLTGYNGILGYRTDRDSPIRNEEIEKVKPVIAKLKENGWTFASHSYGHYHMAKMSTSSFKFDIDSWKSEVESLVGKTRVFLYPYGEYVEHSGSGIEKINYLIDVGGFDIHCGVSVVPFSIAYQNYAFEDRKNIDGLTLRNQKKRVSHIFDADYVIDTDARN